MVAFLSKRWWSLSLPSRGSRSSEVDKNIGFRRNIYLSWLDATAALCTQTGDTSYIRDRLDPILEPQMGSPESRRISIDILLNIWIKTGEQHPELRAEALDLF